MYVMPKTKGYVRNGPVFHASAIHWEQTIFSQLTRQQNIEKYLLFKKQFPFFKIKLNIYEGLRINMILKRNICHLYYL